MGGRRGTDNAGGRGTINSEACRMSSPWKLPEVITFYLSALRVPNQAGPPQALCVCVCVCVSACMQKCQPWALGPHHREVSNEEHQGSVI